MEIEFKHLNFTEEPIFSKIVFTDSNISGKTIYPWRERKKEPTSSTIHINPNIDIVGGLLGGHSNQISSSGEVCISSLKSILYSFNSENFSLWIKDNENNSLIFTINAGAQFYTTQINELLKTLSKVAFPTIINSILQGLSKDKPTKIDKIEMYINGISLDWNRIFKTDKLLVSWNRLNYKIHNNTIIIREYNSSFIKSEINTTSENACLMPFIIDIMKNNNPFKI